MAEGREQTGGSGMGVTSTLHQTGLQTALSTQIKIYATGNDGDKYPIGAIQSLAPTETRPLLRISEVGTDAVVEIIPQAATTIELSVTRIIFDFQRLPAAFQRGFRHINAARLPFDIVVEDYNAAREVSVGDVGGVSAGVRVTTTYKNCWINTYSFSYTQDNYMISETATIWAEHVYDSDNGTGIAVGGDDTFEATANESATANTLSDATAAPTVS